ncbi:WhiB family transcriptional regulator [[Mycobacterium] burgundiense]|jgi:WhiB family redox-sensing transcriptional regulator|uniref:Transcriptional regulator WhiB n=1 Tax=[Mycobacterium] burgundiense TaxID=3064286 RepID=A0ABM9L857_9MYCO|nr:WhiB family transcriptional regulator [Mycolicibacterium sp. MU0053]CAJ1494461.1 WhiB family transcriptional regulator [Mycolicibacterium sp. MU0053]
MTGNPCAADPDLWFGYSDDDEGAGAAKARSYESAALEARALCLRRCPLAQQRQCARRAVEHGVEFGVWAGIKLPGNQYRKRGELARAHAVLRRIAAGEISARQLPENAALLERRQHAVIPEVATVFHLTRAASAVSAA